MVKANAIGCPPTASTVPAGDGSIFSPLSYSASSAASSLALRDAQQNSFFNNAVNSYQAIATAGATSTLTNASAANLKFTGTLTQTVVLPAVSTLVQAGFQFTVYNTSTGVVTVQSSGANTVQAMQPNSYAVFTANAITGTDATVWDTLYIELDEVVGAITTLAGSSGSATGTTVTFDVASTGLTLTGSGSTLTFGGVLAPANGGTGLSSPGSAGNVLTSNGTSWVSQAPSSGGLSYVSISSAPTTAANTVYMATAALTVTLPSAPSNGYVVGLINASSGTVLFQASGTDVIQISSAVSTAGGTATSTVKGESMLLVYEADTDTWYAPSAPQGSSWDLA